MIPIFKKLRKEIADDNKAIKYIRYAVGEIVLVVIGILIAKLKQNLEIQINERLTMHILYGELCFE